MNRRTPLRPVSDKRRREERLYTQLRRSFLGENPYCQFPDCGHAASTVQHKRGRVGADFLDTRHWAGLCLGHHQWVTEHPAEAYELGLSERRVGRAS